jgi:membrane protease subunit (stomatin/prohibitin family)
VVKGFASALGLGGFIQQATAAAQQAQVAAQQAEAELARCPKEGCGWTAPKGTKFCAQCGGAMVQPAPAVKTCPHCGQPAAGKFCSHCGGKLDAEPQPAVCPQCGKPAEGKFCANCGYKLG